MRLIKAISHIHPILHGGYESPAGLSLQLNQTTKEAHLFGLTAPNHATSPDYKNHSPSVINHWTVYGTPGFVWVPDMNEVETLRQSLEAVLNNNISKIPNERPNNTVSSHISNLMTLINLSQETYKDWTRREDPITYRELFEDPYQTIST